MSKLDELKLETQVDYFWAIEGLGATLYTEARLVGKGEIEATDDQQRRMRELAVLQVRVSEGLRDKFGVIMSNDPIYPNIPLSRPEDFPAPPKGRQWYAVWYRNIKATIYGHEYEQLVCSGCPFSLGKQAYVEESGRYPCSLMEQGRAKVYRPWVCECIHVQPMDSGEYAFLNDRRLNGAVMHHHKPFMSHEVYEDEFYARMKREHGVHATLEFRQRKQEIERRAGAGIIKFRFGLD